MLICGEDCKAHAYLFTYGLNDGTIYIEYDDITTPVTTTVTTTANSTTATTETTTTSTTTTSTTTTTETYYTSRNRLLRNL